MITPSILYGCLSVLCCLHRMDLLPAESILEVADCMFSCVAQGKSGSAKKARRKAAKGKDAELVPHYEVLACEYHISIVAGLVLIGVPCA